MRSSQRNRRASSGVVAFIIIMMSLQVFLVTVAAEALLDHDAALAWATAAISVVLFAGAAAFLRFLRP